MWILESKKSANNFAKSAIFTLSFVYSINFFIWKLYYRNFIIVGQITKGSLKWSAFSFEKNNELINSKHLHFVHSDFKQKIRLPSGFLSLKRTAAYWAFRSSHCTLAIFNLRFISFEKRCSKIANQKITTVCLN